ncbi:MAG: FAD-dependent monooxygenase [Gammaproteobacteria bacterium]
MQAHRCSDRRCSPDRAGLAIALQQAGVKHVLIDKLARGQNAWRAAVIRAHTLEVLDALAFLKRGRGRTAVAKLDLRSSSRPRD